MRDRVMALAIAIAVAGCGRRAERAWFDASPPSVSPLPVAAPLPPTALHVRWSDAAVPRTIIAGAATPVSFSITNAGNMVWPDIRTASPEKRDGSHAVRLNYKWVEAGKAVEKYIGGMRVELPHPIAPGERVTMHLEIPAPARPGEYRLVFDLLQELVLWFSDFGADTLTVPVRVLPAGAAADQQRTRGSPRP